MRKIFKKLGFHRPDEMEQHILLKAQRISYLFLVAALVIWSFYESGQVYRHHGSLNLLPCLLLVAALIIQTLSQLILTHRAVKDSEETYETGPFIKIVTWVCVIAGVFAAAVTAVLMMGGRV